MSTLWKIKARNAFTHRWSVLMRGSEDACRQFLFIEERAGFQMPYDDMKLEAPRRTEKARKGA